MEVNVKWIESTYPSFNVMVSSQKGAEPFITIKSCSIKEKNGREFISYPAKKPENGGKWFNYIYASDKFNDVVMSKAKENMPVVRQISEPTRKNAVADMDSNIPF